MNIDKIHEQLAEADKHVTTCRDAYYIAQDNRDAASKNLIEATDKKDVLTDQLIKAFNKQKVNK